MNRYAVLILIFTLNLIDSLTTVCGLFMGYTEINPLFPGDSFTMIPLLALKICLPVTYLSAIAFAYKQCKKEKYVIGMRIIDFGLIIMTAIYIFIIANNVSIISGLR